MVYLNASNILLRGRVKSYIMGQYSANQLGLQTTANAGGVSNAIVESSFNGGLDEMIKAMDTGLIVTELMGQGVNGTTGDLFSWCIRV
ncbi:TldE protein, part of TldE/TldD proteolytic complex, partial [uncultured Gammaproteobacteria bacterium]